MPRNNIHPEQIDALLPQTQCGLCGYPGCMPYAEALSQNRAAINLCPPGGVEGLMAIAALLNEDATPFIEDMTKKAKPPMLAFIREDECIGCTKCIQACPVDAIIGTGKRMHTVIRDECTGCELCVPPCPVDCIDMLFTEKKPEKNQFKKRYLARQMRLKIKTPEKKKDLFDKKAYIEAALLRAKTKKMENNNGLNAQSD